MNNKEYKKISEEIIPSTKSIKKLFVSFICGGIIGLIGQLLLEFYLSFEKIDYNMASNLMMMTFIIIASLLTGIGVFDSLVTRFGAGLIIPITGFSHSTTSSAMEYSEEGLVNGIGSNIFKLSGSVILYGVISAFIFGIIRFIFFGG